MQAVKRVSAGNLSIQVYIWGKTKMDISYDYYRTFYYVAKYKSFTGAAEALLNSQPNITRTMKKLEKELGCTLFVRQRHGIALTPEARSMAFPAVWNTKTVSWFVPLPAAMAWWARM